MRLRLFKQAPNFDYFTRWKLWLGISGVMMVVALVSFLLQGLNFGIDFRTESPQTVDIGEYRAAMETLGLGDITITEVFDPSFRADQNVAMIRIQAQDDEEAVSVETIEAVEAALTAVRPDIKFVSVESVGPKVSGELIQTAAIAVLLAIGAVLNDTVVVFDRVRENLRKYKKRPLAEVLNLSINETMSRTFMTSFTTLLALIALFVLGGDVIRGFVFAMIWGVIIGTYSSIFVASAILLYFGVKRDWSKPDANAGNQYANIDA